MLAATLSPSYGIYSGFENLEGTPGRARAARSTSTPRSTRSRTRTLDGPLLPLMRRLNEIRRASPPLRRIDVRFVPTENPALLAYVKGHGVGAIIVVRQRRPARRPGGHRRPAGRPRPAGRVRRARPGHRRRLPLARRQELRPSRSGGDAGTRSEGGGMSTMTGIEQDIALLAARDHHEPAPRAGGPRHGGGAGWCASGGPRPTSVRVIPDGAAPVERAPPLVGPLGGAAAGRRRRRPPYEVEVVHAGHVHRARDPYAFLPTLGELDLHLVGRGPPPGALGAPRRAPARDRRHHRRRLRGVGAVGALDQRRRRLERVGRPGAPDALARLAPGSGSCSCRASAPATTTSSRSAAPTASLRLKADPARRGGRGAPADRLGRRLAATHEWRDDAWMEARAERRPHAEPVSIYEVHLPLVAPEPAGGQPPPHLPRARRRARRLRPRHGLHPRRAAAGDGAPVLGLLGLPGHLVLRAHADPRHARTTCGR